MAFCINCGQELVEGAKFCAGCGKAVDDNTSAQQRKTVYDGEIHKCPNCGDTIDAYETVCEACGYEIRGRKTTSVVHELALKLEKTDDIQKKEELIRNFYIPNTKEDIYEFMILANSNIGNSDLLENAWIAKFEQAHQKSKIIKSNIEEFEELYDNFKKEKEKAEKRERKKSFFSYCKRNQKWLLPISIIAFSVFIIIITTYIFVVIPERKEIYKLENLVIETQECIKKGDYSTARVLAKQIDKDGDDWAKWYEVQDALLDEIENAEAISIGEIKIGISYKECIGKNYKDVIKRIESAGFTNIEYNTKYDLIIGAKIKDGEITDITINGSKDFDENSKFLKNATIVVTYHTFKL